MATIPVNNNKSSQKDNLIERIVKHLENNTTFSSYHASDYIPRQLADEVCREFVDNGYYAKMVFFCDGRASYQSFHISKNYLAETRARMVYSEMY